MKLIYTFFYKKVYMSSNLQNLIDSINNMQTDKILLNPPQPIMTLTAVEVKNSNMKIPDNFLLFYQSSNECPLPLYLFPFSLLHLLHNARRFLKLSDPPIETGFL